MSFDRELARSKANCSDTVESNGSDINSFPSGKKMHLTHRETSVCSTGSSRNSEKMLHYVKPDSVSSVGSASHASSKTIPHF